jgi:hypothetical protein
MQPNQVQPGLTVDYLNHIAPQAPKKGRFSTMQLLIFGGAALILIIIVASLIAMSGSPGGSTSEKLAARLLSTETIVSSAQTKLKSTELRTLSSNLKIYLTNTNRDIIAPLKGLSIDVAHLDPVVVKSEAGTDVTARLEDARLNAVYDRTYAREISYRLDTIVSLMQKIRASTGSSAMKSFLDNALTNLTPTQKQFADYNDTNS